MADQEIKDLTRALGRVQASLTRTHTLVQQYDETQDVLNIKLRMGRKSGTNTKKYRVE